MKSTLYVAAAAGLVASTTATPIHNVTANLRQNETFYEGSTVTVTGIVTADFREYCDVPFTETFEVNGTDVDENAQLCGFVVQTSAAEVPAQTPDSTRAILVRASGSQYMDDTEIAEGYKITISGVSAGVYKSHPVLYMDDNSDLQVSCTDPEYEINAFGKLCEAVEVVDYLLPVEGDLFDDALMLASVQSDMFIGDLYSYTSGTLQLHPKAFPLTPTQEFLPGDNIFSITRELQNKNLFLSNPAGRGNFLIDSFNDTSGEVLVSGMPYVSETLNAVGIKAKYSVFLSYLRYNNAYIPSKSGLAVLQKYSEELAANSTMYRQDVDDLNVSKNSVAKGDSVLRVSGFNLLNYFTTLVSENGDARGAYTQQEFELQEAKIHEAMIKLDAAVFSMQEMENINNTALTTFVTNLNERLEARELSARYAAIESGKLGVDVIRTAIIYNSLLVEPVGNYSVYEFNASSRHRPSIAQTFTIVGDDAVRFTVLSNHFKSKGSSGCNCDSCPVDSEDPNLSGACDAGDGQGWFAKARYEAAKEVAAWVASNPTGQQDPEVYGNLYLMAGDFNAYKQEDAIRYLVGDGGFVNLADRDAEGNAVSYAYGGFFGTLDYLFASEELAGSCGAVADLGAATEFHINSREFINLRYYKSDATASAYASSDHDPAIVACRFSYEVKQDPVPLYILIAICAIVVPVALVASLRAPKGTAPDAVDAVDVSSSNPSFNEVGPSFSPDDI